MSLSELMQNLTKLLPQSSDAQQQFVSTEEISADPDLLIYRRIEHQFECDGELQWFAGTVLSYNNNYRVQYDTENEIYSFPLLDDLNRNEVRVFK